MPEKRDHPPENFNINGGVRNPELNAGIGDRRDQNCPLLHYFGAIGAWDKIAPSFFSRVACYASDADSTSSVVDRNAIEIRKYRQRARPPFMKFPF